MGIERVAVVSGAKCGGGGEAEQIAEMEGNCNLGGKFGARHKIRSVEELVLAMNRACERVEGKIDGQLLPGSLLDGAETRLRDTAKVNAVGRTEFQIAAIA